MPLAYYVHSWDPFIVRFTENFGLRWYGLAYVMAFAVGLWLYRILARRGYSQLREEQVGDFIVWAALFGVLLGGRLGYMLFYGWREFFKDPLLVFRVHEGGMASHGGILGLMLFTLWYAWRHKISWTGLGDNLVVVAPVGLLFGRLANFVNGELYGRVTSVPWAVQFPRELEDYATPPETLEAALEAARAVDPGIATMPEIVVRSAGEPALRRALAGVLSPRHPSQLYEAALEGVLLFAMLWWVRTHFRVPRGLLTGLFFVCYALFRIFCEQFREPDAPLTLGLSRGQFLSLFMLVAGAAFMWFSKRPAGPGTTEA